MLIAPKLNVSIHNRFDIIERDARTMEVTQVGQAENIVLDRIYTRLCTFNTYFVNIVFGRGTGTPTAGRTTLFNRISSKAAVDEQLIRAYPVSVWTRRIRLETTEFNGETITEVGISDHATNINTHALIQDAEGNPLALEKTALKIIDIYATVYATVYSVDTGFLFDGDGLRNYLTGATVAADQLGIGFASNFDDYVYLSSARTNNTTEKWVQTFVRFNVQHFNKDIRFLRWDSIGLRCEIPRPGVFADHPRTGVNLGAGDGVKTKFPLPNKNTKDHVLYINGIQNDVWQFDELGQVDFGGPGPDTLTVTADYVCNYVPKDADHVFDVTMRIVFGGAEPTPVVDPPQIPANVPGATTPIAGDLTYGFFGEVAANLINGEDLCSLINLTAGTLQHSGEPWLKFARNGRILFVHKKTIRHTVSWDNINAAGAVFGDKIITINGVRYIVRLMSTSEWNALMYPVHVDYGQWHQYTDADLLVHHTHGNGNHSWTSTPSGSNRIGRGNYGVSGSIISTPSSAFSISGFRPVLEVL